MRSALIEHGYVTIKRGHIYQAVLNVICDEFASLKDVPKEQKKANAIVDLQLALLKGNRALALAVVEAAEAFASDRDDESLEVLRGEIARFRKDSV